MHSIYGFWLWLVLAFQKLLHNEGLERILQQINYHSSKILVLETTRGQGEYYEELERITSFLSCSKLLYSTNR